MSSRSSVLCPQLKDLEEEKEMDNLGGEESDCDSWLWKAHVNRENRGANAWVIMMLHPNSIIILEIILWEKTKNFHIFVHF